MAQIRQSTAFAEVSGKERSIVFEIVPNVFKDNRGMFTEVLKQNSVSDDQFKWITDLQWIKQINRSMSVAKTVRGMHAQVGEFCQGKLVEAVTSVVYDIIIDARPDSSSFGVSEVFKLDPELQNKVWVPRGFLHGFAVPDGSDEAVFQYYCDNVFNKPSEIGICPIDVVPKIIGLHEKAGLHDGYESLFALADDSSKMTYSEKDKAGSDYESWMKKIQSEFNENGLLWYC